jgi:hypothetical protein
MNNTQMDEKNNNFRKFKSLVINFKIIYYLFYVKNTIFFIEIKKLKKILN